MFLFRAERCHGIDRRGAEAGEGDAEGQCDNDDLSLGFGIDG
jgi:hypothetical protein